MHTAGRMIRLRSKVREMARVRVSIRVSTVELVCYFVGILRHSGTLWAEYECDKTDNTQLYGYTRCRYIGVGLKSDGTDDGTLSRPRICKPLYGLSQDDETGD